MSDRDDAREGIFGLVMIVIVLATFFMLYLFSGEHAHGQELTTSNLSQERVDYALLSEEPRRSQLGVLLPKGCFSRPCGFQKDKFTTGIAEVVQCPHGSGPPEYMDFKACKQ